jgi:hypothetical protein
MTFCVELLEYVSSIRDFSDSSLDLVKQFPDILMVLPCLFLITGHSRSQLLSTTKVPVVTQQETHANTKKGNENSIFSINSTTDSF